jgi:quercetin dioxygenase-like cupin family protein
MSFPGPVFRALAGVYSCAFIAQLDERVFIMKRVALIFIVAVAIGTTGLTLAHPDEKASGNGEHVTVLATYDVKEKVDGKDASVTMVEVTFDPRGAGASHRHPGPAFVYVVEGTYELGVDDQPTKIYKAGETFHEPSGWLHRVSRNPASTAKTKLIALVLHPRSAKDILTPADH